LQIKYIFYLFNRLTTSDVNEKELKRRNSDGSTTHTGKTEEPKLTYSPSFELLEWKGTTMFTIAGHRFRKLGRFTPQDKCTYCNKLMDAFLTQGHKCSGKCDNFVYRRCLLLISYIYIWIFTLSHE